MDWKQIYKFIDCVANFYSGLFWYVFSISLVIVVFVLIAKYQKKDEGSNWYDLSVVLKRRLEEVVICCLAFPCLLFCLDLIFDGHFNFQIPPIKYIYIIVTLIMLWMFFNVRKGVKRLKRYTGLYVNKNEGNDKNSQIRLLKYKDSLNLEYELQKKHLDILRFLSPISLVPVFIGLVFDKTNQHIDWTWYIIVSVIIILFYFYRLYKCYKNMKETIFFISYVNNQLLEFDFNSKL